MTVGPLPYAVHSSSITHQQTTEKRGIPEETILIILEAIRSNVPPSKNGQINKKLFRSIDQSWERSRSLFVEKAKKAAINIVNYKAQMYALYDLLKYVRPFNQKMAKTIFPILQKMAIKEDPLLIQEAANELKPPQATIETSTEILYLREKNFALVKIAKIATTNIGFAQKIASYSKLEGEQMNDFFNRVHDLSKEAQEALRENKPEKANELLHSIFLSCLQVDIADATSIAQTLIGIEYDSLSYFLYKIIEEIAKTHPEYAQEQIDALIDDNLWRIHALCSVAKHSPRIAYIILAQIHLLFNIEKKEGDPTKQQHVLELFCKIVETETFCGPVRIDKIQKGIEIVEGIEYPWFQFGGWLNLIEAFDKVAELGTWESPSSTNKKTKFEDLLSRLALLVEKDTETT